MCKRIFITIPLILATVISMSSFANTTANNASPKTEKLEPLYGIVFSTDEIEILVNSNGCTRAEDFELNSVNVGNQKLLTIRRIKNDRCRAMPKVITIKLEINEQDSNTVYDIGNRFVVMKK